MAEPWLSVEDIAADLESSTGSGCKWIAEQATPARRASRLWALQGNEIDSWVKEGASGIDPGPPEVFPAVVGGHAYSGSHDEDEEEHG